jgi:hypothetical protein
MCLSRVRALAASATITILASAAPLESHGALDSQVLKQFGGTYSPDCRNPAAARASVAADALTVVQQKKRLSGGNVQASYAYFGRSEPEGYQVALISEVRGSGQLVFIMFHDRVGRYLTLSGEPKVTAALGKALTAQRFRLCA